MKLLFSWLDGWRQRHGLQAHPVHTQSQWQQGIGRVFLHVGCGSARKKNAGPGFQSNDWQEVRLDIDAAASPDIVASMLDMDGIPDAAVDAVFSSHNIEHLYPHEVPVALAEFFRVLKPDGLLVLTCPDLQSICGRIADDHADEPAYQSPSGPISPLDVLYGHGAQLAAGNLFMAHHFGFTLKTLTALARTAGFPAIIGIQRIPLFELWLLASRETLTNDQLLQLANTHFPK